MKKNCDICGDKELTVYVDGRIINWGWANFCPSCVKFLGVKLGTGKGQLYKWSSEKKEYEKIKG